MDRDPSQYLSRTPDEDDVPRCHQCGARLHRGADWCSQCYARVTARPFTRPGTAARVPSTAGYTPYRPAAVQPRPAAPTSYPPSYPSVAPPPLPGPDLTGPARAIDAAVAKTAGAVVLLNVLMQVGLFTWTRVNHVEPEKAIRWSLFLALVFYGSTYLLVASRLNKSGLRILWRQDRFAGAGRTGVMTGVATFLVALAGGYLITHRVALDPTAVLLVGGNTALIVVAFALLVLIGPLIEELLFRGLILQSLRYRGVKTALLVSSILFFFFHLRPGFIYYTAMGLVFGGVYLKRGLKASFFAHAAFNGCIVLTALAMTIGPARVVDVGRLTLHVPRTWNAVAAADVPESLDAGFRGPSGAGLLVGHEELPSNVAFDSVVMADALNAGRVPMPGVTLTENATTIALPTGPAVRARVTAQGHAGEIVFVTTPGAVWTLVLMTGGSSRALNDFHRMLQTLELNSAGWWTPPSPAAP